MVFCTLHLIEGLEILPDNFFFFFFFFVVKANNCFFHQTAQVTSNFCGYGSNTYTIIVIGGEPFALIKKNSNYVFSDSHSNIPYGATIVVFTNIRDILITLCSYGGEEIVYYACLQVERI